MAKATIDAEHLAALVKYAKRADVFGFNEVLERMDCVNAASVAIREGETAPTVAGLRAVSVPRVDIDAAIEALARHRDNCHIYRAEHLELGSLLVALKARLDRNA